MFSAHHINTSRLTNFKKKIKNFLEKMCRLKKQFFKIQKKSAEMERIFFEKKRNFRFENYEISDIL